MTHTLTLPSFNSCEVWLDLTKGFIEEVEKCYKSMVIPTHTCYAAVLAETGLMKVKHMLNRAMICYINHAMGAGGV